MECSRSFSFFLIMFSSFGALLSVLSLSMAYWQRVNTTEHTAKVGLWIACSDDKCTTIGSIHSYDSVRAMMFLGFFFMLGTVACITISTLFTPNNDTVDYTTMGLSGLAGLFFLSGFATFSDQCKIQSMDYGSSYYLAVVSWLMAWIITGIYCHRKFFKSTGSDDERQRLIQEQPPDYNRPISGNA